MGFRFRKSFSLGKGFKVNTSKSGVGFSWGIPGFRLTKTATGQTRATLSIPGTGMSYVINLGSAEFINKAKGLLGKFVSKETPEATAEVAQAVATEEVPKTTEKLQETVTEEVKETTEVTPETTTADADEMTTAEAQKAIEDAQKAIDEAMKILAESKNTKDA